MQKYKNNKQWVTWKLVTRDGKKTKIPYTPRNTPASSTDPLTWSTYAEISHLDNKGIVFTPDRLLLGIDIDKCINPVTGGIEHEQKEAIANLILEADTYTEYSPSETGLHLFLSLTEPLILTLNKRAPFEVYNTARYFTVTSNFYGSEKEIRTVTPTEALSLLSLIGMDQPALQAPSTSPSSSTQSELTQELNTTTLSDHEVLDRMFSSKTGVAIKKLYNNDLTGYDNDESSADLALCSHLAFWTNKNHTQIERLWLQAPLSNRDKTKNRKDYRNRTIAKAIAGCKDGYTPPQNTTSEEIDLLFTYNKEGDKVYFVNTENICRILTHYSAFKGVFRYDEFKNLYQIHCAKTHKWRELEDNDAVVTQTRISIAFPAFARVGKEMVYDAIIKVSKDNKIDSAKDFIESLVWDKKDRLNVWLSKTYGVSEDAYHRAVASNWIKGLVNRIINPGCKFDYVLVLEGEQGTKKSTSLHVLGRDWHVETAMGTDNKDFFMQFAGKAIIEFSEGETLSRTEVKRMKAIITMQFDKYRPPYERNSRDFPRRCVFAMTTNQSEYLKDETGNRRWLPVAVQFAESNVEWLKENRDQIFAEAYYRLTQLGETCHEFPKEITASEQEKRRIKDPNDDKVCEWYHSLSPDVRADGISVDKVFFECINNSYYGKSITPYEQTSLGTILKLSLGLEKRRVIVNGVRVTRWFEKNAPVKSEMFEIENEKDTF